MAQQQSIDFSWTSLGEFRTVDQILPPFDSGKELARQVTYAVSIYVSSLIMLWHTYTSYSIPNYLSDRLFRQTPSCSQGLAYERGSHI